MEESSGQPSSSSPPLRQIVTLGARSSSASTAIELSNVGPRTICQAAAGRRTPALAPARAARRRRASSEPDHAPLPRLERMTERRADELVDPARLPPAELDLGDVGRVDVAAEDGIVPGASGAARRGRAAARPWSGRSAGRRASARGRTRGAASRRARGEPAPGARADRLVPGLEVVDAGSMNTGSVLAMMRWS